MRDRLQIVKAFEFLCKESKSAALATVVSVEGSSYRHPGARMLIAADGHTWGTISGGCLERDVARRGRMLISEAGKPIVVSFETDEETIGEESARPILDPGPSLGCGGRIEILIQRTTPDDPGPLVALAATIHQRKHASVATVIRTGSASDDSLLPGASLIQIENEPIRGKIPDAALHEAMRDRLSRSPSSNRAYELHRHSLSRSGWADVLFEWLAPTPSLAIFGDGHDVTPLLDLAKALAWHVTIIGSKSEAALRQSFPKADDFVSAPETPAHAVAGIPADSAAVIMAHNFHRDSAALAALLRNPRLYIGVLGPRRRTARLLAAAALPTDDDRIHSPVGLDIGAETSEQIALSIIAEIQAVIANRPGAFLRDREGPIHLNREERKLATDDNQIHTDNFP